MMFRRGGIIIRRSPVQVRPSLPEFRINIIATTTRHSGSAPLHDVCCVASGVTRANLLIMILRLAHLLDAAAHVLGFDAALFRGA